MIVKPVETILFICSYQMPSVFLLVIFLPAIQAANEAEVLVCDYVYAPMIVVILCAISKASSLLIEFHLDCFCVCVNLTSGRLTICTTTQGKLGHPHKCHRARLAHFC